MPPQLHLKSKGLPCSPVCYYYFPQLVHECIFIKYSPHPPISNLSHSPSGKTKMRSFMIKIQKNIHNFNINNILLFTIIRSNTKTQNILSTQNLLDWIIDLFVGSHILYWPQNINCYSIHTVKLGARQTRLIYNYITNNCFGFIRCMLR